MSGGEINFGEQSRKRPLDASLAFIELRWRPSFRLPRDAAHDADSAFDVGYLALETNGCGENEKFAAALAELVAVAAALIYKGDKGRIR